MARKISCRFLQSFLVHAVDFLFSVWKFPAIEIGNPSSNRAPILGNGRFLGWKSCGSISSRGNHEFPPSFLEGVTP